uniref:DnaJ homolog subfamily C member 17 n=1 Tax=Homalodisca liturata TaxID=320908 RepID=A0A1B6INP3_9HEMI
MDDITKIDLYELLGILPSATVQEVKKAYRKKALKCHPDKNPDNARAGELFHQLSRALEILIDESARAAYDKVINAKKAAALRNKELDSKRKKLKEDLEAKERQAQTEEIREKSAEEKFKAEIDRLRKEGSKQLEEEIEFVRSQIQREKYCDSEQLDLDLFRLKVKWKVTEGDQSHNTYNHESLTKIFSKYGEISALVVSNKKKGSALLEFNSSTAAINAQRLEQGFLSNPLSVSWLRGRPPSVGVPFNATRGPNVTTTQPGMNIFPSVPTDTSTSQSKVFPCFHPGPDIFKKNRQEKQETDFEAAVLSRMRQAEEEKRRLVERGGS